MCYASQAKGVVIRLWCSINLLVVERSRNVPSASLRGRAVLVIERSRNALCPNMITRF